MFINCGSVWHKNQLQTHFFHANFKLFSVVDDAAVKSYDTCHVKFVFKSGIFS